MRLASASLALTGNRSVVAPTRMRDVIGASAQGAPAPQIDEIEHQRGVHADGGMQRGRQLPGPVTHAGNVFAVHAGGSKRQRPAVAGQGEALAGHAPGNVPRSLWSCARG